MERISLTINGMRRAVSANGSNGSNGKEAQA